MPFVCSFCGSAFCAEHRLPENHGCSEYWRTRIRRDTASTLFPPDIRAYAGMSSQAASRLRFSLSEVKHIAIGIVLVSAVGLSFFNRSVFSNWIASGAAVLFFTAGFVIHELTHKAVAQRYGLWAEFRLDRFGALLTAISFVSPFKIIAPGAVVIMGETSPDRIGRTAVAGPTTNILLSLGLFGLAQVIPSPGLAQACLAGAAINALMAVFNLVPFGVLDGHKVLRWNKPVWLAMFAVSALVTALSYWSI